MHLFVSIFIYLYLYIKSLFSFLYQIEARSVDHLKKLNKGMENKIIELQQKFSEEVGQRLVSTILD